MIFRSRRSGTRGVDGQVGDFLRRNLENSGQILTELQRGNRPTRFWISTVIALLTLVASVGGIWATLRVRDEVQTLSRDNPQEVVDRLRLGQTENDIRQQLGREPIASEQITDAMFATTRTLRRVLFDVEELGLAIEVLFDPLLQARIISVTTLDSGVQVTYPGESGGTFSWVGFHRSDEIGPAPDSDDLRFKTNHTTLGELVEACNSVVGSGGIGASWGYLAVGCPAFGYNNFSPDIVSINLTGPVSDWEAASEGVSGELRPEGLTPGLRQLTFNSFVLIDGSVLVDGGMGETFEDLVAGFAFGPRRGEMTSVN